jgi:hypothetical protein
MHHATTVMIWILALLGAASLVYGLAGLLSRPGAQSSKSAVGRFWMGLFVLVETGPRLAGWPSEVVLALSVLAFVPVLLAGRAFRRP